MSEQKMCLLIELLFAMSSTSLALVGRTLRVQKIGNTIWGTIVGLKWLAERSYSSSYDL